MTSPFGKPEGIIDPQQELALQKTDTLFKVALLSVLGENIVDSYASIDNGKDIWSTLETKFGVLDAGTEMYIKEQFYEYMMTHECSVVEQAHEIQSFARDLENFNCMLPEKFVAGGIITKLPPSGRNFATSLMHKRQEFSVSDLLGTLDVEKRREQKTYVLEVLREVPVPIWYKRKNFQPHKFKNKGKFDSKGKFDGKDNGSQHTNFKKKTYKKKSVCDVCEDPDHWAPSCPNHYDKR